MIADLKPYADYKDTGVSWLGKVPAHWQIVRSKRLFTARQELARPDDVQLSATQAYGVIAQSLYEERTGYRVVKISMHLDKRRHVERDDFIISMRSFQGGLERAWSTGAIRSSYVVLKPDAQVDASYFRHLFKSVPYIAALRATGDFIRDGQDLNYSNFCGVDLPLMPVAEQIAIGRFLDWANARLDRAIRAKRKVIALVMEQKQAIINRAVTGSFVPDAQRKPCAIPTLESIPVGWTAWPFVRCTIERADYRGATPEKVDSGIFLVTAKNVRKGWIDYSASKEYVRASDYSRIMRRGLPKKGDVLLTMEAPLGHVALIDREDIALAQRVVRFRLHPDRLLPQFALHSLNSTYFQGQLQMRATGSTAQGIKASKLPQLSVVLPPIQEQRQIVAQVELECAPLDRLTSRLQREIELLREFHASLIAEVVTGKRDVRRASEAISRVDLPEAEADLDHDPDATELTDEETEA